MIILIFVWIITGSFWKAFLITMFFYLVYEDMKRR